MTQQIFILPKDKAVLSTFIDRLPMARKWKVTVDAYRRTRSNPQNNALWGVAYPAIKDATGNDPEDLHTMFCGDFFGWVEYDVLGQRKKKPRRTTTTDESGKRSVLTTLEFMDFYEHIQRKCAEFGVYVPSPGELEAVA